MKSRGFKRRLSVGFAVFGALIGIKVVEYFFGTRIHSGAWPYLVVLAFAGAWLILSYFMHIGQLGESGSKDHDNG